MKRLPILCALLLALALAFAFCQDVGKSLAFYSPVPGCEGLQDLEYAYCCLQQTGRLDLCPTDSEIDDPEHSPISPVERPAPPPERPKPPKAGGHEEHGTKATVLDMPAPPKCEGLICIESDGSVTVHLYR